MNTRLFIKYFEMPPPRGRIDGGILEILFVCNGPGHIFHVDLNELAGVPYRSNIFVDDLAYPVLPDQLLFLQYLADRALVECDSFLFELPVNLQGTFLSLF